MLGGDSLASQLPSKGADSPRRILTVRLARVVLKAQDLTRKTSVAQGKTINAVWINFPKVEWLWWIFLLTPTHLLQWSSGVFATKEWKKVRSRIQPVLRSLLLMMMIAFSTVHSGLVPLIECLCARILYFRFEIIGGLRGHLLSLLEK